jgi:peptidoglycan/xylan/chitin deacetylase (PgdA/CDA1 family)
VFLAGLKRAPWLALVLLIGMVLLVGGALQKRRVSNQLGSADLLMLVPDGTGDSTAAAAIWLDAAKEEGVAMHAITMSEFLERSDAADGVSGLVLPDSLIRRSTAAVIARVIEFNRKGGRLMVVNDALMDVEDRVQPEAAPLADVVGLSYGTSVRSSAAAQPVLLTDATRKRLRLPPGKTLPLDAPAASALLGDSSAALAGYQYGVLRYPVFSTAGRFPGKVLLADPQGDVVAGVRLATAATGGVLFVNLPLGFLKGRTDGLLLHAFLHYFAFDVCSLPVMSVAPDDIGRLVFNWHIDSNAANVVLDDLNKYHLADDGPFSIDVTAGPDVDVPGDHRGLDLAHNLAMQRSLKALSKRGDEIGSHGGWIHNYFGKNVDLEPTDEMREDLEKNVAAIAAVTGIAPREYSAPLGNQPPWVTDWLEQHGFVAYYFTGNADMAPTRSYRNGELRNHRIWSFPILVDGDIASFEEADGAGVSQHDMEQWLDRSTDFVADEGTIRTFYSHPHSFPKYLETLDHWLQHVAQLKRDKRFAWITMPQAARFLDQRLATRWNLSHKDHQLQLSADNSQSLEHQAWRWPAGAGKPQIEAGNATISPLDAGLGAGPDSGYRVVAGAGTHLVVSGSVP